MIACPVTDPWRATQLILASTYVTQWWDAYLAQDGKGAVCFYSSATLRHIVSNVFSKFTVSCMMLCGFQKWMNVRAILVEITVSVMTLLADSIASVLRYSLESTVRSVWIAYLLITFVNGIFVKLSVLISKQKIFDILCWIYVYSCKKTAIKFEVGSILSAIDL